MKIVYVTKPATADWWDEHRGSHSLARTVHEPEATPVETGLLDANGAKLYRVEKMDQIGFVRGPK